MALVLPQDNSWKSSARSTKFLYILLSEVERDLGEDCSLSSGTGWFCFKFGRSFLEFVVGFVYCLFDNAQERLRKGYARSLYRGMYLSSCV